MNYYRANIEQPPTNFLQTFRGPHKQLKSLCPTWEKDGHQCNMSLVDGNGRTPQGMENGDGCVRVLPSSKGESIVLPL